MKKKLIAIVTSLAMVATMVPATAAAATAAAPQANATVKVEDATTVFITMVRKIVDADKVTESNVTAVAASCRTALNAKNAVPVIDGNDAAYKAASDKLDAVIVKVKSISIPLMEKAINAKAQTGKVEVNDGFTEIREQRDALQDIGMETAEIKAAVSNYNKYEDAMNAGALAILINTKKADLEGDDMTAKENAVKAVKYSEAYIKSGSDTVRKYAENYKIFSDADRAVTNAVVGEALILSYLDRIGTAAGNLPTLQADNTEAATNMSSATIQTRVRNAEALLDEADQDTSLKDALDAAKKAGTTISVTAGSPPTVTVKQLHTHYNDQYDALKTMIDNAATIVENKRLADVFTSKVNALPSTPGVKNAAAAEEIYQAVLTMATDSSATYTTFVAYDSTKAAEFAKAFNTGTTTNWGVEVSDATIASAYAKLCAMNAEVFKDTTTSTPDTVIDAANTVAKTREFTQNLVDAFNKALPSTITTTDYDALVAGALAVFGADDATGTAFTAANGNLIGISLANKGTKADPIAAGSAVSLADIAGTNITDLTNVTKLTDNIKYAAAQTGASGVVEKAEARAAVQFIESVVNTLNDKKTTDADYEIELKKAQKAYEALPNAYKKGGKYYNDAAKAKVAVGGRDYTVKFAYDTDIDSDDSKAKVSLKTLINNYEEAQANVGQTAIFSELVKGINALPATITIADKDTVYALRDKRDVLTAAQKETFKKDYEAYDEALDKAIKAVDEAVVADLNKTLGELTIIDAKSTPEDIQKAKAANKAARDEYEKLTDSQKAVVTNYPNLQAAEAAVDAAEVQYAKDQMAAVIKDIDLNALTEEQVKAILAVNDMINALNGAQKTEVEKDSNYAAFQEAVKAANGGKPIDPIDQPKDLAKDASVANIAAQTYNGKAKTPAITVTAGGKTLVQGTDYTATYKNNTNIGRATVTITGAGDYTGTITTTFIIKPAVVTLSKKPVAGKKQITVSYKTQKSYDGKTGYRIICKTKGIKATAVNTTANGKKTIKGLKSGKTYQVKVRAYKTIGGTKYYSATYSKVQKVKVK